MQETTEGGMNTMTRLFEDVPRNRWSNLELTFSSTGVEIDLI